MAAEAPAASTPATDTLKLICISVDDSEHSERAFKWFLSFMYRPGIRIGIVHVHQLPAIAAPSLTADAVEIDPEWKSSVEKSVVKCKELITKFRNLCEEAQVPYEVYSTPKSESIGAAICHVVEENHAKGVVVGSRGLGAIRRTVLGSVSDYVVHHCSVPVTVVPPTARV